MLVDNASTSCDPVHATPNVLLAGMISLPDASMIWWKLPSSRELINTSASSDKSTQPHLRARKKNLSKFCSISVGVAPHRSPHVIGSSGLPAWAATHSAVDVLPTPGTPCNRMTRPLSLPFSRSLSGFPPTDVLSQLEAWPFTSAQITSSWPSGRARLSKPSVVPDSTLGGSSSKSTSRGTRKGKQRSYV